jgi:hypothetical protein
MKLKLFVPAVIALLVSATVIASPLVPNDPGTVNALSTTAENCLVEKASRNAFMICNMEASGGIDIRYLLVKTGDTSTVVTTAGGIELKPQTCDSFPIGGEPVFKGRVSCIAESGTPNANTLDY